MAASLIFRSKLGTLIWNIQNKKRLNGLADFSTIRWKLSLIAIKFIGTFTGMSVVCARTAYSMYVTSNFKCPEIWIVVSYNETRGKNSARACSSAFIIYIQVASADQRCKNDSSELKCPVKRMVNIACDWKSPQANFEKRKLPKRCWKTYV